MTLDNFPPGPAPHISGCTAARRLMNRPLGILIVLLALTFSVRAQNTDDLRHGNQAPGSVKPSDAEGNRDACQHGWAKCNRASLSPSEVVKVTVTDHQRNVSNCRLDRVATYFSEASKRRSLCGSVRGSPVLSSHFSPGLAPQVGQRTFKAGTFLVFIAT